MQSSDLVQRAGIALLASGVFLALASTPAHGKRRARPAEDLPAPASDERTVAQQFGPPPPPPPAPPVEPVRARLSVQVSGTGTGAVRSSPPGIDCGSGCSAEFGTPVMLSAHPGPGSRFAGWSGACQGLLPCELPAQSAAVGARFDLPQRSWFPGMRGRPLRQAGVVGLGLIALAGISSGIVLFGLHGNSAGPCEFEGMGYNDCIYNLSRPGAVAFSIGLASAGAAVLL